MPKGAIVTHRNVCAVVSTMAWIKRAEWLPGDVYLSFLPLAHMFERLIHVRLNILYSHFIQRIFIYRRVCTNMAVV